MALGTSEVTLAELTAAYATVARGGARTKAYGIRQITRDDGAVLYSYAPSLPEQAVSIEIASMMTQMLASAVQEGTGRAARLDRPVAGKTGTTSDSKDGWFIGFTGDLTTGVWLGRDDAKPVPGLAGGRLPTLTWADYMRAAVQGIPPTPLLGMVNEELGSEPDQQAYGLEGQSDAQDTLPADGSGNSLDEQSPEQAEPSPQPSPQPKAPAGNAPSTPTNTGPVLPQAATPQPTNAQPASLQPGSAANPPGAKAKLNREWLEGVLREAPPPKQ
jgi:penicillin-binding protein 1A